MNKSHIIYQCLLALCGLFLLTNCSDELQRIPVEKGFALYLQPQTADAATRATEAGEEAKNENKIDYANVHVWFFDSATGNLLWKPALGDMTVQSTENKIIFSAFEEKSNSLNKTVKIVVLANVAAADVSGVTNLSDLETKITTAAFNNGTQPSSFAMRGEREEAFGASAPTDVKTIDMQRLGVKIRAMYPVFSQKMAAALAPNGTIEVKLISYVDKSYLSVEHYYSSVTENPLKTTSYGDVQQATSRQFYSYARDYVSGNANAARTFLMYKIPYRLGDGTVKSYYYKVDVSGSEAQNPEGFNKLQSNKLYEVKPIINGYGAESEEETDNTASVSADISIIDWTSRYLDIRILDIHYFVVRDTYVVMPSVSSVTIPFDSDLPVTINPATDITAKTVQFTVTPYGNIEGTNNRYRWNVPNWVDVQSALRPTVTIDNVNKTIKIDSPIPNNYVPKQMTITLHSGDLQETIIVDQYPLVYIEALKSKKHSALNGSSQYNEYYYDTSTLQQHNATLYIVNAITAAEVYAGSLKVRVGNPASVDAQGNVYTRKDAEANQLVSPRFAVASQIGIHSQRNHTYAENRCKEYAEYDYGPGTWRVPTAAELLLIGMLQYDENSAVNTLKILNGENYWTAEQGSNNYYIVRLRGGFYNDYVFPSKMQAPFTTSTYPVRCVRDLY